MGYDALRGEFVDMIKVGIVDPTKVTRSALQKCCISSCNILNNRICCSRYSREKPCCTYGTRHGNGWNVLIENMELWAKVITLFLSIENYRRLNL